MVKNNEKLQPNPDRMRNGPEVSGIKVCFTPLVKNKDLKRCLLRWRKYRMSRKRKKLQTPAEAM